MDLGPKHSKVIDYALLFSEQKAVPQKAFIHNPGLETCITPDRREDDWADYQSIGRVEEQ